MNITTIFINDLQSKSINRYHYHKKAGRRIQMDKEQIQKALNELKQLLLDLHDKKIT